MTTDWTKLEDAVEAVRAAVAEARAQEAPTPDRDAAGEYGEAVSRFVDGVVADILGGSLRSQEAAMRQVDENVVRERYVADPDLAVEVLLHASRPTADLWQRGVKGGAEWSGGKAAFPFQRFAAAAFASDAKARLVEDAAYKGLPETEEPRCT